MSNSALLDSLLNGNDLEETQAYDLMQQFAAGELEPAFAGALLAGLRAKGETADEIRGFARAMRELAVHPEIPEGSPTVDTVGTGGDGSGSPLGQAAREVSGSDLTRWRASSQTSESRPISDRRSMSPRLMSCAE